jgi:hypothetical protein
MIMLRATSLPSWMPVPRLVFRVFTAATIAVCPKRVSLDVMRLGLLVIGCRRARCGRAEVKADLTGKIFSKDELAMVIRYRDEYRAKHAK